MSSSSTGLQQILLLEATTAAKCYPEPNSQAEYVIPPGPHLESENDSVHSRGGGGPAPARPAVHSTWGSSIGRAIRNRTTPTAMGKLPPVGCVLCTCFPRSPARNATAGSS